MDISALRQPESLDTKLPFFLVWCSPCSLLCKERGVQRSIDQGSRIPGMASVYQASRRNPEIFLSWTQHHPRTLDVHRVPSGIGRETGAGAAGMVNDDA